MTTPIFAVKKRLVERYGRMASLSLFTDIESAEGEITDDRLTLQECGIEGGPAGDVPPSVTLYFDYRPFAFDEPVLLATHRSTAEPGPAATPVSSPPPAAAVSASSSAASAVSATSRGASASAKS